MSILTDGNNDRDEVCNLMVALQEYADNYDGQIDGVASLGIDMNTSTVNGEYCVDEGRNSLSPLNPSLAVQGAPDEKSNFTEMIIAFGFCLFALLLAIALFMKKRRSRLDEEQLEQEHAKLQALGDDEEDDDLYHSYGYERETVNAVNVHRCRSAQCTSCQDTSNSTEFVPIESVDNWVKKNSQLDDDEGIPPPPPPEDAGEANHNDSYHSERRLLYPQQGGLGPIEEDHEYDEPGQIEIGTGKDTGSI